MLFLIKRKILFGLRLCILQLASRVPIRKTFVQFFQKKAPSFAFVALHFCAKNITLRNHSQTYFRAKPRYSAFV